MGQRVSAQTGIGGQTQIPAVGTRGFQTESILGESLVERRDQRLDLSGFNLQHPRIRQQYAVQVRAQMHRIGPQPPAVFCDLAAVGQPSDRCNRQINIIGNRQAKELKQDFIGIPAPFMLAQAALETGWGKREIIGRDGTNSHNLFGIKAGGSWTGPTVEVTTTEYIGGQPRKMIQKFRAYANEAESFADYARLMKDSPRYAKVLERAGDAKAFAMGLQKAGYATDPLYGQKLGQVINTTLRLQREA